MRALATCATIALLTLPALAESTAPNWLEQGLYGQGKFNTVVVVVSIIIVGIGIWMWRMDARLKDLESRDRN
jgi:hypothetical protein